MKEHERREYLKTLDEEKRKREESKFEEMKKKHGDHPKVHHPVRPQPVLVWLSSSSPFQREKANRQKGVFCLVPSFASSHCVGTMLRALQTPVYKPHSFCAGVLLPARILTNKDTETHEEGATTVFKTVGMPSWHAWPARNCITVPFALGKAK